MALDVPHAQETMSRRRKRTLIDVSVPEDAPNVLVVDDFPDARQMVRTALARMNCRAVEAGTLIQARDHLKGDMEFDLAIVDIRLSDGERGTVLAREIREQHPDLPVILVDGYVHPDDVDLQDLQDLPRLKKPLRARELWDLLEDQLGAELPES